MPCSNGTKRENLTDKHPHVILETSNLVVLRKKSDGAGSKLRTYHSLYLPRHSEYLQRTILQHAHHLYAVLGKRVYRY